VGGGFRNVYRTDRLATLPPTPFGGQCPTRRLRVNLNGKRYGVFGDPSVDSLRP
jgi:hypothetical protein